MNKTPKNLIIEFYELLGKEPIVNALFKYDKDLQDLKGWLCVPFRIEKEGKKYIKKPIGRWSELKDGKIDLETYWKSLPAKDELITSGIGVICGKQSGVTVIDVDYKAKLINAETGEVIVDAERNPASVYSYSKSFKGEVSKEKLLKHVATDRLLPDARPVVNVLTDRDWGFSLTKEEISRLTAEKYYVEIETDFSYAKLKCSEAFVEGKIDKEIVLVAFIDGPYKTNEHLSGVVALLELLREAKDRKPEYGLRFLITVSGVGLACWLEKNKQKLQKVEAILILTSLGKGELFTLQVSNLKNPLVGKLLETFKSSKKPYQLLTEGLYNSLPFGGNPFVYHPNRDRILKNIERLEKEFHIKGRTDFLKTAEEIFELEIPQKVIVFGRTLPANTLFFPFKGRGTDKDTPEVIDWGDLTESVEILKSSLL